MSRLRPELLKRILLFLVLVAAALAQTESEIESDEVKRVGTHIACQCGACQENVNCNMSSGQCHFCKPARTKIYKMQRAGMSDDQVIASFVKEYGQAIFRADPNSFFWLIPYVSLAAGGGVLWLVLKRMRGSKGLRPATGGPAIEDDPVLAKYRAAIEKDTDRLD
jgi:cytochrome c-type biogenesis protein CcmH/NrfF